MLQLARRTLGLDPIEQSQTRRRDSEGDHGQLPRRPASRQPAQPIIAPPQDTPSTTDVLARAGRDCSLSPATRTVLTTILTILNDRPTARIRLTTLITQTSLARRTIQAALRRLEAANYLVIAPQHNDYGGHMANQYTLSAGGGRSPRSPLNINTWKGGQPAQPSAEPTATIFAPAAAPTLIVPPCRVELVPTITAAPVPAPSVDAAPPFHAQPVPEMAQVDANGSGATFDPGVYAAWVATLDDQTARPWTYSRSPRQVMQGHQYGMAELLRGQAERQSVATSAAPSAEPSAPRLSQSLLTLRAPAPALGVAPVVGVQALRAELARIEREARRYFAQKAPNAGKQAQIRAAAVRRQLAELEGTLGDRLAGAAKQTPTRRKVTAPPSMFPLGSSSGDFGAVAIGDINAGVAQLEGEGFAGGGFGKTIGGDGAAQKLFGVGGAKSVHAQTRSGSNAEVVTGLGDLALGDASKATRVGEDVVTVTGNSGENARVKQAGDQALATTLGVAPGDLDCFIFKIDVLDAQAGQLVDAQAATEGELGGELHLAGELADDGLGVGLGEAEAWGRAGRARAELGDEGGFVAPPAALAHPGLQFVQPGNGGAETTTGELAILAGLDVGRPVGMGDGAQLVQSASVALLLDPANGGDDAGLVGAQALVAKNSASSGAVQLGLMAAGAGLENTVKGVGYLLDQRASRHGRSPPGAA